MQLIRKYWNKNDIVEFQNFLLSFSKGTEKGEWEKRIINTALPCIAVPSDVVKNFVKEIYKGDYISFIDLWIWENWTNTSIIGQLICKIPDFDMQEKYLDIYVDKIDNWASCDLLKFKINQKNKSQYWNLAQKYIHSKKTFIRRAGVRILFQYIDDENYLPQIFTTLDALKNEKEYYVNMICAWLLAECFTKQRDKTLDYLKCNNLNDFVMNKGIQKCRDSYRISAQDKEMLLLYKRK